MTTYRELINEARNDLGGDSLTFEAFNSNLTAAIDSLAAANKVINKFKLHSVDYEFADIKTTVELLSGNAELQIGDLSHLAVTPGPGKVDIDMIKWLKAPNATEPGTYPVKLIATERAEELEQLNATAGQPRFYYIDNNSVKVIPTPDKAYTLRIGYQRELTKITGDNIDNEVPWSQKWDGVFRDGVFAYLKKNLRHSDANATLGEFFAELKTTARHLNKWSKKKSGQRKFKAVTRKRSRRIF